MTDRNIPRTIDRQVHRLTDVTEEPLKNLTPISGYADMPLVSLEESVKPLVCLLPQVLSYAHIAKQNCQNPADELTQDQSASIMLYTMGWEPCHESLYYALNNTLRTSSNRQEHLKPWFLYLRLFLSALFRLRTHCITAYRGVKLQMIHGYKPGETVTWWGFSSCATDISVLESNTFLGKTDKRTIFTVECQTARAIHNHSFYPTEKEILLSPGTQFQVIGSLDQGDLRIIQLREVIPPFPLLQPLPNVNVSGTNNDSSSGSYRNVQLEKHIHENRTHHELKLRAMQLTDEDMEIVASRALHNNATITFIDLGSNAIGAKGMEYLSRVLSNNKVLHMLNITENRIDDQAAQYLSRILQHNQTLAVLDLWNNRISEQGAQCLSYALYVNQTLTTLNIGVNHLGAKGAEYFSHVLRQNKTLTSLNLWDNKLGECGVQYLSDALRNNNTLRILNLGVNQMGDRGLYHLSEALRQNKTLTTLEMAFNNITDEGLDHFNKGLINNQSLTTINLIGNPVGDKSKQCMLELNKHRNISF